ncbi:uncharacterized protein LOC111087781 [Limulus polyphemus]|uniref:Uncharacterized protein LOC111087781 n=1 Tax=Limulus polyphemus TaxID=6850 RepID=A0ABM1T654_LIMPO|nr:uncharacterized protein LOC111087781 [Limulus polyphemus]
MVSSGQTSDLLNKIQTWSSPNCSLNLSSNHTDYIQCKHIQPSNTFQESDQLVCDSGTSCSEANNQVNESSLINPTIKNNAVNAVQVIQLGQDRLPEVSQTNNDQETIETKSMKTLLKPEIQVYDFPHAMTTNQYLAKPQISEQADIIRRNSRIKSRVNETCVSQNGDVSSSQANQSYPSEDVEISTGTANVRRKVASTRSDEILYYSEGQQITPPSGQSTFPQSTRKTPTCYWAWRYWTEKGYSVPPQTATACSCNSCYRIPSFRSCFQNRRYHPYPHRFYWSSGTPQGKIPEAFLPGEINPEGTKVINTMENGANRINPVQCRRNSSFVNRDTPNTSYSFPYSTENNYDTYWYMYSPIAQGSVPSECTSYKDERPEGYKYHTFQQSEQEGVPINQVNPQDNISTPQQYPAVSESLYTQLTNVYYSGTDMDYQTNNATWQASQGIDAIVQGKIITDFGNPDGANAEYNTYSRRNITDGRDEGESNFSTLPTISEANHVLENKVEYSGQVSNDVNGADSTALHTHTYSRMIGSNETQQPMDLSLDVAPETLAGSQSSQNSLVIDVESHSPVTRADQ